MNPILDSLVGPTLHVERAFNSMNGGIRRLSAQAEYVSVVRCSMDREAGLCLPQILRVSKATGIRSTHDAHGSKTTQQVMATHIVENLMEHHNPTALARHGTESMLGLYRRSRMPGKTANKGQLRIRSYACKEYGYLGARSKLPAEARCKLQGTQHTGKAAQANCWSRQAPEG